MFKLQLVILLALVGVVLSHPSDEEAANYGPYHTETEKYEPAPGVPYDPYNTRTETLAPQAGAPYEPYHTGAEMYEPQAAAPYGAYQTGTEGFGPAGGAKPKSSTHRIGEGLIDLAFIAEKNAKRAIEDSKPTFTQVRKGLGEKFNEIYEQPELRGLRGTVEKVRPKVENFSRGVNDRVRELIKDERAQRLLQRVRSSPTFRKVGDNFNKFTEQVAPKVKEVTEQGRNLRGKLRAEHEARMQANNNQQAPGHDDYYQ